MRRVISPGALSLVLTLIAGIWLILAPVLLDTQPRGAAWTDATINEVAVGGVLILVSLIGLFLQVGLGLRDWILTVLSSDGAEVSGSESV